MVCVCYSILSLLLRDKYTVKYLAIKFDLFFIGNTREYSTSVCARSLCTTLCKAVVYVESIIA